MKNRTKQLSGYSKGKLSRVSKQTGMNLLEVLVATLLCGIALAIAVGMFQASQRNALNAEYRARGMREIQALIDEIRTNKLGVAEYGVAAADKKAVSEYIKKETCENRFISSSDDINVCKKIVEYQEAAAAKIYPIFEARIQRLIPNSNLELLWDNAEGNRFSAKLSWTRDKSNSKATNDTGNEQRGILVVPFSL